MLPAAGNNQTAVSIGRKMIRAAGSIIDLFVLILILLLVAVSVYAVWDSGRVYQAADSSRYAAYKPSQKTGSLSFADLQKLNHEVIGWLDVYGTSIDYPVTQGQDNVRYVNTDAFGSYSLSGAIFLDYQNDKSFRDFNSILYGHHMERQAMFGELEAFGSEPFFNGHRYGNLYYDQTDHGLEFFAFIKTDAYDDSIFTPSVAGPEAQRSYLQNLLERAMYTREIGVEITDHILLLTTCSTESTNGRDILAARISGESFADPFTAAKPSPAGSQPAADQQNRFGDTVPVWLKIVLPVILLILLAIAGYQYLNKKQKQE